MSDTDTNGEAPSIRVNDKRRFDPAGNPREEATEAAAETEPAGWEAERQRLEGECQRLGGELEGSRRRVDELARGYQELLKDREDFKQRLTRERERMMDVERGNVALMVLEAVDELDRCLSMGSQGESPLTQGVKMIRDGLLSKLQSTGIERLRVVGLPYDPNTAEATDMEITPNPEEDQRVVEEARAGYRLKDRVIRPARVKVAKYVVPAQA